MELVLVYLAGFLTPIVIAAVGFFVFRRRVQRDPGMLLRTLPTVRGASRPPLHVVTDDPDLDELFGDFGGISPESS